MTLWEVFRSCPSGLCFHPTSILSCGCQKKLIAKSEKTLLLSAGGHFKSAILIGSLSFTNRNFLVIAKKCEQKTISPGNHLDISRKVVCYYFNLIMRSAEEMLFSKMFLGILILIFQTCNAIINVDIVTMGQLYPNAISSLAYNAPAVQIAVSEVQELYKERFNFRLSFLTDKTIKDCPQLLDETNYLLSRWYYNNKTDLQVESNQRHTVLISPACSEPPLVNALAAEWNLLYISTVVTDIMIRNKNISPTYLSTAFTSLPEYAETIVSLLAYYSWSTVFIVIDDDSLRGYSYFSQILSDAINKLPNAVKHIRRARSKTLSFLPLLRDFQSLSRVMIYLGHGSGTRKLLIEAALLNMTQGEHIYITYEIYRAPYLYGNLTWNYMDEDDEAARTGFASLLIVMPNEADSSLSGLPRRTELENRIKSMAIEEYNVSPSKYNEAFPIYITGYAATHIYAQVLNESYQEDGSFELSNSKQLIKSFFNRTFYTDAGQFYLDSNGERKLDLVIRKYDQSGSFAEPFLTFNAKTMRLEQTGPLTWMTSSWPPANEPYCGYEGKSARCIPKSAMERVAPIIGASVAVFLLALLGAALIARKRFMAAVLFDTWWRIASEDLQVGLNRNKYLFPFSMTNVQSNQSRMLMEEVSGDPIQLKMAKAPNTELQYTPTSAAMWKGKEVMIIPLEIHDPFFAQKQVKLVMDERFTTNKALLKKMLLWRDFSHVNIVRLFGIALVDHGSSVLPSFVTDYMERGSLWDLFGTEMHFSVEFLASFAQDLIRGFKFIHSSGFVYHGSLSSKRCLSDKYFSLKISNLSFADITRAFLDCLGTKDYIDTPEISPWTPPEGVPLTDLGRQQADIFSIGIVLWEIFNKRRRTTAEEPDILKELSEAKSQASFTENHEPVHQIPRELVDIISSCCTTTPHLRPSILTLEMRLSMTLKQSYGIESKRQNLVDGIIQRLGLHAEELEVQVDRRTADLTRERERCDQYLEMLLPKQIVGRLRNGQVVDAEVFSQVTIMFSDLDGFVEFVANNPPLAATQAISSVEAAFDKLLGFFDVRKVEAITDSFMTSSGVPTRNGSQHVFHVSGFALGLQREFATDIALREWRNAFRVGIHTGPCAAGIVGFRRLKYCLFGDTINTSSRMCSHGKPGRIHLSSTTAEPLSQTPAVKMEYRGKTEIKGKNAMDTYWLIDME